MSPTTHGLPAVTGALPVTDVPLVAVAHGSRDPRAAATVEALMDGVRHRRPGLDVRVAYLDHTAPTLAQALDDLSEAAVLPLLLTEAYHTRVDIPRALAEITAHRPHLRVHLGVPLGPHALLVAAMERRLSAACPDVPAVRTITREVASGIAVVLVGAGSRDARANAMIDRMARVWARKRGWWAVRAAYASAASPTPTEAVTALRRAGAPRVVVAPYLLAPGYFADKIRRDTLAAGAHAVADVLGPAPEVAELLLHRHAQAVRGCPRFVSA